MPSTAIRDMSYDATTQVLEVEFTTGAVYEYFGVPPTVYRDFRAAPSRGRYFAYHFRDRFPYRKTQPPRPH
jgi:hypothetical protein